MYITTDQLKCSTSFSSSVTVILPYLIPPFLGDGGSTANDLLVAQCNDPTPCAASEAPWSLTFSEADIATLSNFSGPLILRAVQNSEFFVALGETRLIESTESSFAVPSVAPVGLATLLSLMGPVGYRRLRA